MVYLQWKRCADTLFFTGPVIKMTDITMRGGEGEVDTISEGGNRSKNTPIVNYILTFCVSILFNSTPKKKTS